ncbi:MAG: V-type ATP synthase subunit D [Candidatus Nanopelagicales bacterium]|jgi:V/A-type H+-transporting ATPase subunit D|nr:V-type ATP synthase subunit D [Candidatus Nanopelagicales bacterium]
MTPRFRGLPPGRAGLPWLARRRAMAERGSDLLERKLRILLAEEEDYALRAERTRADWHDAVRQLDRWMLRSALLSGERALRLATDGADARVEVDWRLTMGVRYPADATCALAGPGGFQPDNTALHEACDAARRAVLVGVDHAVATAALEAIRTEIAATRRQLRALDHRWLPRLEAAHAQLLIQLDDIEHDEHVRLRWAAVPRGGRGAHA